MINKVILLGNLGADPETRTTSGGTVVCNLRVATTERVKKGDAWEDHTEWHRVVCFGRTADNAARFLTKGRQVYVEGRLRANEWTDKDGNKRTTTEIIADDVRFLGGGRDERGGRDARPAPRGGQRDTRSAGRKASPGGDFDPDDVPF